VSNFVVIAGGSGDSFAGSGVPKSPCIAACWWYSAFQRFQPGVGLYNSAIRFLSQAERSRFRKSLSASHNSTSKADALTTKLFGAVNA
jgi:hypothetical protein